MVLAGGTAGSQLFVTAALPILTRLYSPAEMGWFGTFLSYVAIGSVITSLRYELAIVAASTEDEANRLTVASIAIAVPITLLLALIFRLAISQGWAGLGILPQSAAYWAIPALFSFQAFTALRYWYLRRQRFTEIARFTLYQGVVRAAAPIALAFCGIGWLGLAIGEVLGRLAGVSTMVRTAFAEMRSVVSGYRLSRYVPVLRRHREFPIYALPSSVLDAAALNLPLPLIGMTFGAFAAGEFALIQRALQAPLSLLGRSISDAFHARLAVYVRTQPRLAMPLFLKTSALLLALGMVPTVLLILFAEPLFALVFGAQWREAGSVALYLLPWTYSALVVSPLSRAVQVLSAQRSKLIYDATALTLVLAVLMIAAKRELSFRETLLWLSVTQTIAYLVYYALLYKLVSRLK